MHWLICNTKSVCNCLKPLIPCPKFAIRLQKRRSNKMRIYISNARTEKVFAFNQINNFIFFCLIGKGHLLHFF